VFFPRAPARRVPAVLAALLLAALVLVARAGAHDALQWATASNVFMRSITESQPFESLTAATKWLGLGTWLVLPAFAVGVVRASTRRDDRLVPWLVAVALLVVAATLQRRFAEALAAPSAVLCAWLVGHVWSTRGARLGASLLVLSALHLGTLRATLARLEGPRFVRNEAALQHEAIEAVLAPLRALPPEARRGVLAEWDHGHAIEWWGGAPTLATNFGLYLGADDFLDPWRFLLASDDGEGAALLERRDVGFVFVTRDARRNLAAALAALGRPALDEGGWRRTQVARLVASDRADAEAHAPYLRLVASSGFAGTPGTYARLFERVAGAEVVVDGEVGARVALRMRVEAADGGLLWSASGAIGSDGTCVLRVPYPTEHDTEMSPFGAPGVARTAELTVAGRPRSLVVRASDVREGARVTAGG
jgi:asparagine N-glycosylation enzyme membrane subunit Stt3